MTAIATILIGLVGSPIPINQNWLAGQGPGPYFLTQAGATYVLQADVTTPGTAFIALAPNLTLDLNGHTVTYDNRQPITVANGGFEQGTSPTHVPGWDVARAPGAVRAPARAGMWGDWMLRLPDLGTTATIISSPIPIPQANVQYAAIITPKSSNEPTVTLSVVDSNTGAVLGSGKARDPDRGFSAVARFTATTTHPVRLQVTITPPAGKKAKTVDLDYAALYRTGSYGVVATPSVWNLPPHLQSAIAGHGDARTVANFTVQNGSIVQGGGDSFDAAAVLATSVDGITIDHVNASASGADTSILDLTYASNPVVTATRVVGRLVRISDRMRLVASLQLSSVRGPVRIEGNVITGTMQAGISFSRREPVNDPILISRNVIEHETLVTNGYGIIANNCRNFEIASNRIKPVNGRGLLLDTVSKGVMENGRVHDNIVEARERPNLEYAAGSMEAIGMTIRVFLGGAVRNVTFTNNTFSAETGLGGDWAAAGVRVSVDVRNTQMADSKLVFQANTFQAVLNSIDPSVKMGYRVSSAWALSVPQVPPGTGLQFINNTFQSNHVSLNLGDDTGYQSKVSDVFFAGNTISKLAQGAAPPYQSVAAGNWDTAAAGIRLFSTAYTNGAPPNITFLGRQPKEIEVGRLLSLMVTNADGTVAAGAAVSVLDRDDRQVFRGVTNARGALARIPIATVIYRQTGPTPTETDASDRGPFNVMVSAGSRKKTLAIAELSRDVEIPVRLP